MGGIFLGFLCAVGLIWMLGRLHATEPPGGRLGLACWTLIALTGVDGLNAFLSDGNLPHLYAPTTPLRLLTGLGAGLGLGLMAVPVVASVVWSRSRGPGASGARGEADGAEASIEDPLELVAGLVVAGLVGGLVLAGNGALLWPVALAMLAGVIVAFGFANLYVVVLVSGRAGQAVRVADLRGGLISSLGLVLLELGGLAALRGWLGATFGLTWGI